MAPPLPDLCGKQGMAAAGDDETALLRSKNVIKLSQHPRSHLTTPAHMLNKISLTLLFGMSALPAFAQVTSDILAPEERSAYLQDTRGVIVRGGPGLCWRNGHWTPADAVPGCDGELLPPLSKPTAPAIVPPPLAENPAPAQAPPAAPARASCDFTITMQGEEAFAFGRAGLTTAAQSRFDADVLPRLAQCSRVELLRITGHTDRLGSRGFNQELSEKRAGNIARYLQERGVRAEKVEVYGAGETLPIKECGAGLPRKQLVACLAANRRVTVEVRGSVSEGSAARQ